MASFQSVGTSPDSQDLWQMIERGPAVPSAPSFSTRVNPIRPHGLLSIQLIQYRSMREAWGVVTQKVGGTGLWPVLWMYGFTDVLTGQLVNVSKGYAKGFAL